MNINYYITKKKLFHFFILDHYLCDDIIQLIIQELLPYNINHQNLLVNEIKTEKKKHDEQGGYPYNLIWDQSHHPSKFIYPKHIHPFLKDEHNQMCGCYQCLARFDYPRYNYLLKRCRKPMRGPHSKLVNYWILFLSYITGNQGVCDSNWIMELNCKINNVKDYGFVTKYDKSHNLMKKKKRDGFLLENLRLRSDKNKCFQLMKIWENIQLF